MAASPPLQPQGERKSSLTIDLRMGAPTWGSPPFDAFDAFDAPFSEGSGASASRTASDLTRLPHPIARSL
jgi:hypothetical protein